MKINILHRTTFEYSAPVPLEQHLLRMRPRECHGIRLQSCTFTVSVPHRICWIRDIYENNLGLVDFTEPADSLKIEGEFALDVLEVNPFAFNITSEDINYPFAYSADLTLELGSLLKNIYSRDCGAIEEWMRPIWHSGKRVETLRLLQDLNSHINHSISNQKRFEKGVQTPAETLMRRTGACRDLATLFIEACRFLGLAARFVSGYMYSSDITESMSMHGWAEVYLPGAGWVGFDPSCGILVDWHYIPVVVTRHSEQAAPISGTYFGTRQAFLNTHVDLFVRAVT